ncbi:SEC12-like protein 2 [Hordeum vulgare]|nr:SEC12-like protein 2 [Hordeum vulgare]
MLEAVLEHIEGNNSSRFGYALPPAFSHHCGNSWMPMWMETSSSSSYGSRSFGLPTLLPVKPEPQETPIRRRTRIGDTVINERATSSHLVKPKTGLTLLPVKQEHLDMAAADETALKWAQDDYVRGEMEHQRLALEEIAARRRGREEGDIVIIDDNNKEAPEPPNPVIHGDPGHGCSKDGGCA